MSDNLQHIDNELQLLYDKYEKKNNENNNNNNNNNNNTTVPFKFGITRILMSNAEKMYNVEKHMLEMQYAKIYFLLFLLLLLSILILLSSPNNSDAIINSTLGLK